MIVINYVFGQLTMFFGTFLRRSIMKLGIAEQLGGNIHRQKTKLDRLQAHLGINLIAILINSASDCEPQTHARAEVWG